MDGAKSTAARGSMAGGVGTLRAPVFWGGEGVSFLFRFWDRPFCNPCCNMTLGPRAARELHAANQPIRRQCKGDRRTSPKLAPTAGGAVLCGHLTGTDISSRDAVPP
jgi:hypothetical protein